VCVCVCARARARARVRACVRVWYVCVCVCVCVCVVCVGNQCELTGAAGFVAMINACGSLLDASTGEFDKAKVQEMWRHQGKMKRSVSLRRAGALLASASVDVGDLNLC